MFMQQQQQQKSNFPQLIPQKDLRHYGQKILKNN